MHNIVKTLDWDSDFFGFPIAKVMLEIRNQEDLILVLNELKYNDYVLAYYSSAMPLHSSSVLEKWEIKLVDIKMTYVKNIKGPGGRNELVNTFNLKEPTQQLLDLSVASGLYSRFNLDKKISSKKFEELYKLWITNSVSKKFADEVFVYEENNEIFGFVTLSEKNGRGDIGIIAVKSNCRGKGIGTALVASAESYFFNKGLKQIQVITQMDNEPACKMYEKYGFTSEKREYFYHLWKI